MLTRIFLVLQLAHPDDGLPRYTILIKELTIEEVTKTPTDAMGSLNAIGASPLLLDDTLNCASLRYSVSLVGDTGAGCRPTR
jgi:hypothetical protein